MGGRRDGKLKALRGGLGWASRCPQDDGTDFLPALTVCACAARQCPPCAPPGVGLSWRHLHGKVSAGWGGDMVSTKSNQQRSEPRSGATW